MLLNQLKSVSKNTKKTIRNSTYSRVVNLYIKYIENKFSQYMNTNEISIGRLFEGNNNLIKEFIEKSLRNKYEQYIYFNLALEALKVFYKHINKKGIITNIYLKQALSFISVFKAEPEILSKLDSHITHSMLKSIVDRGSFYENKSDPLRFRAIIFFIFYTGIRRHEIEKIMRSDFDLDKCSVKVRDRVCYYPIQIRNLIYTYFSKEVETKNAFNITNSIIGRYNKILSGFKYKGKQITLESLRDSNANMIMQKTKNVGVLAKLHGETDELYLKKYALREEYVEKIYKRYIKIKE